MVRLSHHPGNFFTEWKSRERLSQPVHWRANHGNGAYRTFHTATAIHAQLDGPMVRAKNVSMVHLGEIVVFGSEPENWYGRNSLSIQLFGQPRRCQRLVNAVRGSGK